MAWWMPFARYGATVAAFPPPKRSGAKSDEPGTTLKRWQKDAWGYYKTLGEIHYACAFYQRMLSGVRLYAESRDAAGEWVEIDDGTSPYVQQLERLENCRGGLAALQGMYGLLTFVQGESYLCCTLEGNELDADGYPMVGEDGEVFTEVWEMLSAAELSYSRSERIYTRRRNGTGGGEKFVETDPEDPQPNTMTAYRFYHRDPEYSGLADSSMRAVLSDCEELLLLKQSIRNTARNRGAGNGVLILPTSMSGGDEIDQGDGKKVSKTALAIYRALTAPIEDETAASAVSPLILFAPPEVTSQNAFHIDLRGAALYKETGLRDECIRRIAIGLDMPPENLLGTAGVNHWTAWQIDEAAWKNHGAGVARELVEQLTSALFKPLALDLGDDPNNVRVWYDPTDVVEDPDRGRAAAEAHGNLTISDKAYREATGWEEEDAPDDAEWEKRSTIIRRPRSSNPEQGVPPQGQAAVTPERVIGMAEAAVLRCRELAGSKLRTKLQSNGTAPNLRARIKAVPNEAVASKLGSDIRDECDPDTLVAGAGMVFLRGLRRLGLEPGLAETLVRRVEEHAARTLFDDEPGDLPDEVLAICALTSMRV